MNSEVRLREQAREHLESGKLPDMVPRRVWGGPGVGNECAVCDLSVREDQSEMQVEFLRDHGAEMLQIFHFHLRCFAAWELERSSAESE